MPKISVIVPVYKVEPYIHRCVDSILAQTFTDFELILVDDGSPDICPAICDEYAAKDSRVRVIHQQNGGLSAARNTGLDRVFANSNSEWVSFIDSDDWVHPMYLEALYRAATENEVGVSICGFERTEEGDPAVDRAALDAVLWNTEDFFVENNVNAIVAWGKLYRKADFAEIRYPVGKIHEDEFTTYKLLFRYDKVAHIDQPLYAYYQNPNGIMKLGWTPRRLAGTDALAERVLFFQKHGYHKARQNDEKRLLGNMRRNITIMRTFGKQYEAECRDYLKRYKHYLRKYRRDLSWGERGDSYGFLYPGLNLYYAFRHYAAENGLWFTVKKTVKYIGKKVR